MIRGSIIMFLLSGLFGLGATVAKAQNIALVPELSLGVNKYTVRTAGSSTQKSEPGIFLSLGTGLDLPYNEHFVVRLSAAYGGRSGSFTEVLSDTLPYKVNSDLNIDELVVAAELMYVKRLQKRSQIYGGLGFFRSYILYGTMIVTLLDENDKEMDRIDVPLSVGGNKKSLLNNNNYGIKVRVGYRMGKHMAIELFTKLGIKDLDNSVQRFSSLRTDDIGLTWSYSLFFE